MAAIVIILLIAFAYIWIRIASDADDHAEIMRDFEEEK